MEEEYDPTKAMVAHYEELYRLAREGNEAVIAFFKGEILIPEDQVAAASTSGTM